MHIPERIKPLLRKLLAARLPDWALIHALYRGIYRLWYIAAGLWLIIKKLIWVDPIVRAISTQVGSKLRMERVPYITGRGALRFGDHVTVSGKLNICFNDKLGLEPELTVGDRTFIGHNCALRIADSIRIGSHCRVARGAMMQDNQGHPIAMAGRRANDPIDAADTQPIVIEDDVWIGANCTILPGVRIGRGSIIGAGSIVTRDIPPFSIAAGNPARILRELSEAERTIPEEPTA